MCKYCENQFIGDKPIMPLYKVGGTELIIENGFLYAYCECGRHVVTGIQYCPKCGEKLDADRETHD